MDTQGDGLCEAQGRLPRAAREVGVWSTAKPQPAMSRRAPVLADVDERAPRSEWPKRKVKGPASDGLFATQPWARPLPLVSWGAYLWFQRGLCLWFHLPLVSSILLPLVS